MKRDIKYLGGIVVGLSLLMSLGANSSLAAFTTRFIGTSIQEFPTKWVYSTIDTVSTSEKGRGLLDNRVLDVAADNSGNVAFATIKGVSIYNDGAWNNISYFEGSNDFRVLALDYAPDGTLYAATIDGLIRVTPDGVETKLSNDPVYTVHVDDVGNVFMGSESGVSRYGVDKRWVSYDSKNTDMNFGKAYSVYGKDDSLWVGADRIVRINRDGDQTIFMPMDFLPRVFKAVAMDTKNRLWVGSYNGMFMRQNGAWYEFGLEDGLMSENINDIVIDRDGNPWFATDNGISAYINGGFKSFGMLSHGLLDRRVTGLAVDDDNNVWYSSMKGVGVLKNGKFQNLFTNSLFKDIDVVSWARPYITKLESLGIVRGYDDGNFHPNYNLTRAESLKIAVSASGIALPEVSQMDFPYYDIHRFDDWVSPYAQWAHYNGIFVHDDPHVFDPSKQATRFETLKALLFAFNVPLDYSGVSDFADVSMEESVFVNAAINNGLIGGYNDGTFRPHNLITRAEITKIVSNAIDKFGRITDDYSTFTEDEAAARLQGSKTSVIKLQQINSKYR